MTLTPARRIMANCVPSPIAAMETTMRNTLAVESSAFADRGTAPSELATPTPRKPITNHGTGGSRHDQTTRVSFTSVPRSPLTGPQVKAAAITAHRCADGQQGRELSCHAEPARDPGDTGNAGADHGQVEQQHARADSEKRFGAYFRAARRADRASQ
jgi:hypothetical protein